MSSTSSLDFSEWPDFHDPHRCGTAPFVPRVDGPRQHSCGSYPYYFRKSGCNEYNPNYPDDLYIAQHGCKGLNDCYNDKPDNGGRNPALMTTFWPADGYLVPDKIGPACASNKGGVQCVTEGFSSEGGNTSFMMFIVILLIVLIFMGCRR